MRSDVFITAPEVAAFLCISRKEVYRMIRRGDISAVRVGRLFRIHRESVVDFLKAHDTRLEQPA